MLTSGAPETREDVVSRVEPFALGESPDRPAHCLVRDADEVTVRFHDGREYEAHDIKFDSRSDIAILHIDADGPLQALPMGDSEAVEVVGGIKSGSYPRDQGCECQPSYIASHKSSYDPP